MSCTDRFLVYRTIPLSLLTVSEDGKAVVDTKIVLDTREKTIPLDTSKHYKLNAGTTGVCECLTSNISFK